MVILLPVCLVSYPTFVSCVVVHTVPHIWVVLYWCAFTHHYFTLQWWKTFAEKYLLSFVPTTVFSTSFVLRIADQLRQEGTCGDSLVQTSAQSRVSESRFLRAVFSWVLSILKDGDISEQPVPVLDHLHSKKVSYVYMKFPVCQFVAINSCLVTGHRWEESGSVVFTPPIRYLCAWINPPEPSLLQAEQSQFSQPFLFCQVLQSLSHLCGPAQELLQYVHVS